MIVRKLNVRKDNESCSFCHRGELTTNGYSIKYPYETVFSIASEKSGIRASICDDCLKELSAKTEELNK